MWPFNSSADDEQYKYDMTMSDGPRIEDVLGAALIVDEYCYEHDIDLFGEQANEQAEFEKSFVTDELSEHLHREYNIDVEEYDIEVRE